MKCIVLLTWDDGIWFSTTKTDSGESVGVTLESGSFDALVERVKPAILEQLESNFNYIGEVELSYVTKRTDSLKAISWQPREA